VSRQRVFDFLRDARLRGEWDLLSSGGTMQEMVHIAIGGLGNSVSIINADNVSTLFSIMFMNLKFLVFI
jgi:homeobox-leucine zipper protein